MIATAIELEKVNGLFNCLDHATATEDIEALDGLATRARLMALDGGEVPEAVEVGSWAGLTALVLARRFERLFCVDTWKGSPHDRTGKLAGFAERYLGADYVFRTFCRNMEDRLYSRIFPCRGTSLEYAAVWPRKVALVFIDADHDYEAVRADISAWRPHVAPGGILCGHDYGIFPGVERAVADLIPRDKLHLAGTSIWWTIVR